MPVHWRRKSERERLRESAVILVRYQRFHHIASITKGAAAVLAREQTRFWLLVFAVVVFAALMRGVFVARSDFPAQ